MTKWEWGSDLSKRRQGGLLKVWMTRKRKPCENPGWVFRGQEQPVQRPRNWRRVSGQGARGEDGRQGGPDLGKIKLSIADGEIQDTFWTQTFQELPLDWMWDWRKQEESGQTSRLGTWLLGDVVVALTKMGKDEARAHWRGENQAIHAGSVQLEMPVQVELLIWHLGLWACSSWPWLGTEMEI